MRSFRLLLALTLGTTLAAGTALADGISSGVPYALSVTVGTNTFQLADLDVTYVPTGDGSGGTWSLNAPAVTEFGIISDWDSTYNIDPQVSNNFTVVNNTLASQIFSVTVISPIAPVLPTSLMRGSIGITLTDTGPLVNDETDGLATLSSTLGEGIYRAFLDGSEVKELFPDPSMVSCFLPNCTVTQNADFGIPVRIPGPGASLTMGITVQFILTPGDSASITSVFNIIPVPEPSTAGMLALGLLVLAIVRRRQHA